MGIIAIVSSALTAYFNYRFNLKEMKEKELIQELQVARDILAHQERSAVAKMKEAGLNIRDESGIVSQAKKQRVKQFITNEAWNLQEVFENKLSSKGKGGKVLLSGDPGECS